MPNISILHYIYFRNFEMVIFTLDSLQSLDKESSVTQNRMMIYDTY